MLTLHLQQFIFFSSCTRLQGLNFRLIRWLVGLLDNLPHKRACDYNYNNDNNNNNNNNNSGDNCKDNNNDNSVTNQVNNQSLMPLTDVIQLTLTLKMTTAEIVEASVIVNNSPIQDYAHTEDHTQPTYGDVTRDDSQRRCLGQHSVAMLEQCCNHSKQSRNNVATLCCAKNHSCKSSHVTSPL